MPGLSRRGFGKLAVGCAGGLMVADAEGKGRASPGAKPAYAARERGPRANWHVMPEDLEDKVIDIHSHIGVSLKAYAALEFPYSQTVEDLLYRQKANGVDVNVVFPQTGDLAYDLPTLLQKGDVIPAVRPLSPSPYEKENAMVMADVFQFHPEDKGRFLTFVSVDPGRFVKEQLRGLRELEKRFPIYGIKINPVICQSKITELLDRGKPFLDFVRERNIPFLLHTTSDTRETYSRFPLAMRVIEKNEDIRFCLAHCIGFHREFLSVADQLPNVWVDTAALKIQVQCVYEDNPIMASRNERVKADYSDYRQVFLTLMQMFPDTMIWGSDSPAYSYIVVRKQAEGVFQEFKLRATFEDEKRALDFLPGELKLKASNRNSRKYLFG